MKKQLQLTFSLAVLCLSHSVWAQNTFTDQRDGKTYKTVNIGGQTWMTRNLDYAGEDGDIGVCSDTKNCEKYGRLYKWEDAMLACPDGWHLPNEDEWQTLINSAGGEIAGRKLRAKSGWEKWNCEITVVDNRGRTTKVNKCNSDNFGFSALPMIDDPQVGAWWTASENYSEATFVGMMHNSEDVRVRRVEKSRTLNVRCLKGEKKLPSNLAEKKTALAVAEATKKAEKAAELANPLTTEVTEEGTILRGSTLAKKLAWLDRSAESHNKYIIEVNANENIAPHTFEYKNAINITVVLRGDSINRTLRLSSHGEMFIVRPNVTLILDGNITLQGHNGNDNAMIFVNGGTLTMNTGTTIIGNGGRGVTIGANYGESGTFTMNGGNISGNGSHGVWLRKGNFIMNEGTIFGNNSCGVCVESGTSFTMRAGTISGNTSSNGGGVWVEGKFIMRGGTITGNTAKEYGGGVYLKDSYNLTFTKTGGTITGYNSDQSDGNVVKDEEGVIARRGHAIAYNKAKQRRETTVGPDDNLSCERDSYRGIKCTGVWDDQQDTKNEEKSENLKSETINDYGDKKSFFTDDRDDKRYKIVKIGTQTWMAENLNYDASGSKCYDNKPANCQKYGRIYNWTTAKKACPIGWHLPSKDEWQTLVNFAGGGKTAGNKLKSSSGWKSNGNGVDAVGFSALPGGGGSSDGSFDDAGNLGVWWTTTESKTSRAFISKSSSAWLWGMSYDDTSAETTDILKSGLCSVRCLRD